ncbi:S1 RNA-binding domain-containing protein (plasmid) [Aneurinibacillus sp. Ricciae_BoGa-3]|uniref:S1 RNA-binding domain-containing protein n=1 Tax=Aneurinibacillus sp. Ricciae_BoGa-3 TaxID=3022697 RepID=UPI00233FF5E0|nr:S1 RNA-binding domain-containing protein [Aneurinibacillus sp. Ricciae_BoGa-3]WCK57729.1 S1 RNA-binding domain-containing protein [Aneurinibacillus sp. Ricciae_BoGa-3]
MNTITAYEKAMNNKEILKGLVKVVQNNKELETDVLVLDLDGVKGIIVRDEVDLEVQWKSLVGFLGREVSFVVKEIDRDNNVLICSRKDAQAILKEGIVERLREGEVFNAQVINVLKYGAYVEIEGVTGLLKNVDFAEDYTTVGEVLKVGDSVNVKLRKVSSNDRLIFEAVEKYKNPTIMSFDMFERDQVVLGVVRNVKPWGVYVCIAPGLDALCPIPGTGEVEEGMKVSFRITQIKPEEERVRGKIVRII